jgi:creatinine amidohydrolase/Fe(II)-dependent formamide hydrolase-like protein
MSIDAFYLARESDIQRLRLTGAEEYVLKYEPPPILVVNDKYVDIHAGSMETAIMMKYFPKHVKAALAKKLPRTEITLEDLKNLGKSDEVTREMIPDGYFGDPASYDTDAAERHIKAHIKATADCIEGYLKRK